MRRGKHIQHGSGSLSRSQRKAEKAARRSQKKASEREALKDVKFHPYYARHFVGTEV